MHLELHSPVGGVSLTFPWPLVHQTSQDVIATMKWVLEDLSELKYALEYNVLQGYETDSYESMRGLCARFNKIIDIVVQMEKGTSLPAKRINRVASTGLLAHILDQTYNTSIKNPQILNKYQVFSPEVYGEVSHELMTDILWRLNITPEDIFVDLGSGVGHLVLQLAALSKCKISFGIEKERIRQDYAEKMSENFQKWMKYYGKGHKPYQLIRGDFLALDNREIIKKSSIIFVNNLSFGPLIDHKLSLIFRELKNGTKIITSKSLCPLNMRITERNAQDFGAIAHVFELDDLRGHVSWTNNHIPFYLHVIDRRKLENYRKTGRTQHLPMAAILGPAARPDVMAEPDATDADEFTPAKPRNTPRTRNSHNNKENIPVNFNSNSKTKYDDMQNKILKKTSILAQIHEEQKQRSILLMKIKKLTKNGNNTHTNNNNNVELNKELIKAQLDGLTLKNAKLHEQAKCLQKEIADLENEYLATSQNRFRHFVQLAEAELKLV